MKKNYPVKPPVAIGAVFEHPCKHCGGNGQEPGLTDLTCRECIGRGRRKWRVYECKGCSGKGRSAKYFGLTGCKVCQKRGWILEDIG